MRDEFEPTEKQYFPIYIVLVLIIAYVFYERSKTKYIKIADQVYKLVKEDMINGKYRNGILVENVFYNYNLVIKSSTEIFYSKILPILDQRVGRSKHIHKTLNRSGALVWKFCK